MTVQELRDLLADLPATLPVALELEGDDGAIHADGLVGVAFDDEFILTNYPRGG